ncbi:MAG: hypothetical protein ACKO96_38035 [Flammeovirgaceae bacterium]
MKTFKQIQKSAEKADYTRVAEITGMSPSLIKLVVKEMRKDHHNIQQVFSDMLEAREQLHVRESNRKTKLTEE